MLRRGLPLRVVLCTFCTSLLAQAVEPYARALRACVGHRCYVMSRHAALLSRISGSGHCIASRRYIVLCQVLHRDQSKRYEKRTPTYSVTVVTTLCDFTKTVVHGVCGSLLNHAGPHPIPRCCTHYSRSSEARLIPSRTLCLKRGPSFPKSWAGFEPFIPSPKYIQHAHTK